MCSYFACHFDAGYYFKNEYNNMYLFYSFIRESTPANGMAFEQRPRSAFRKLSTSDDQLRKWYEQILTNAITVIDETGGTIVGNIHYLHTPIQTPSCY